LDSGNWHELRCKLYGLPRWLDRKGGENIMLWTIFIILLVLWLLGLISGYTLGGFIHILLVIAVVVLIIRLIQGRPVV
jgi:antibiotic biosynthesis monooxygenase (ABM) superfamily enzyme